jgi:hypothetical protein
MGGHEGIADVLDEPIDAVELPRPTGDERVAGGAAAEKSEDEVGPARFAPVVVERDDVGVFEPGDEAGLGLEAPDELRRVGQVRSHDLDRHAPAGAGLGGGVDTAGRTLAGL